MAEESLKKHENIPCLEHISFQRTNPIDVLTTYPQQFMPLRPITTNNSSTPLLLVLDTTTHFWSFGEISKVILKISAKGRGQMVKSY
jgi:hypothetical protein